MEWHERSEAGADTLRRQAVRIPLPDREAERDLHENMARIADAGERKARLLDDPDVPLTEVYEDELDEMRQSFEYRLQQVAGEEYYDVATAYLDGERDDWIGALAAYYLECYYRLQERYTVDEQIFFLLILRYPDCFTVNLSFLGGEISRDAVRYESSALADADLTERGQEQYYADSQYSQHEAAEYLRESVGCIREAFPDPDATSAERWQYGGFIHLTGRQGPTFAELLDSWAPDPDRFDEPAATPDIVPEGPEARRAKRTLLTDAEVLI
ncbi:hypothetical protein SAMN06266787_103108 [Halorubrum ezzemoulense]|uniref:Uncharacterized protein n=2 Tax=Halorubrum ezzemoulense TaxID=337243 RepID=A0A238X3Z1_HALEZ|nr:MULTISPECIES: hypothetical protein [Halorubrum]OSP09501.1 hypothetical protein B9H04_05030 [Halorubrum ezzemoulense DSM 17463]OYR69849.1 hypothetical protein DJ79_01910 [Halorubrum ezzemoulense]TKX40464.1 hypothetical protein EXE52_06900 [Halorubrum sp. CGM4_25_10-8A]TKX64040.1 hypothetical protein EXE47_13130 [Halorubrum sp. GN12_10-3_MGM]SNR52569.1 hypothetical protein SAMN06266787_103108 [Halorubrum ezzemoulense]